MAPPGPPPTSAGLLAQLALPTNEAAWRRFVQGYGPYMRVACCRAGLQDADADEVTARVLAKLCRVLPTFAYDPKLRFRGYLTRIIANCVSDYRKETRHRHGMVGAGNDSLDQLAVPLTDFAGDVDERVLTTVILVNKALAAVRAAVEHDTWLAFQRTAIDGEDAGAVARDLGKSVGAVYMAKSRTLEKVREIARRLAADENEDVLPWIHAQRENNSG